MSVVDNILKRWSKDLNLLKAAIHTEQTKIATNNKQIDGLIAANLVSEKEAKRAETVLANMAVLLAIPPQELPATPNGTEGNVG